MESRAEKICQSRPDDASHLIAQFNEVQRQVTRMAEASGRGRDSVTLVVASKTQGPDRILPLLEAGHRVFGENRVQEALGKWPAMKEAFNGVELRLIGPLQTNKAREAVALFDVIETLDRPRLAAAIASEMARQNRRPKLYVEVNTGGEPQKAGVPANLADEFIRQCREEFGLQISGLMCIPPVGEQASPHFALLAMIAKRNGVSDLSMGMSADYPLAIQLGATHVRVGSAIFGERVG
jgi:PLP dependent protein